MMLTMRPPRKAFHQKGELMTRGTPTIPPTQAVRAKSRVLMTRVNKPRVRMMSGHWVLLMQFYGLGLSFIRSFPGEVFFRSGAVFSCFFPAVKGLLQTILVFLSAS